jgi:hypothetical protein
MRSDKREALDGQELIDLLQARDMIAGIIYRI